jgi:hypothetical protein
MVLGFAYGSQRPKGGRRQRGIASHSHCWTHNSDVTRWDPFRYRWQCHAVVARVPFPRLGIPDAALARAGGTLRGGLFKISLDIHIKHVYNKCV